MQIYILIYRKLQFLGFLNKVCHVTECLDRQVVRYRDRVNICLPTLCAVHLSREVHQRLCTQGLVRSTLFCMYHIVCTISPGTVSHPYQLRKGGNSLLAGLSKDSIFKPVMLTLFCTVNLLTLVGDCWWVGAEISFYKSSFLPCFGSHRFKGII